MVVLDKDVVALLDATLVEDVVDEVVVVENGDAVDEDEEVVVVMAVVEAAPAFTMTVPVMKG